MSIDKLLDVYTLWHVAHAMGSLPPEDVDLSFVDYCNKYRVTPSMPRDDWSAELWWLLDDLEKDVLRRTVPLPVDADTHLTAGLTYRGTVVDAIAGGGYFVETGPNPDVVRVPACIVCGKELAQAVTGRPRRFCSATCRKKASRARN